MICCDKFLEIVYQFIFTDLSLYRIIKLLFRYKKLQY